MEQQHRVSNKIHFFEPRLEIFTDASLSGWGAYCNRVKTHGHWNETEGKYDINQLELLAVLFGLKCFANELKNSDILLRVDNTT